LRNRGQSTVEYFVLVGIITAALITMSTYMKRGIQGKFRATSDEVAQGSGYAPGETLIDTKYVKSIDETGKSYVTSEADQNGVIKEEDKIDVFEFKSKQTRKTEQVEETLPYVSE